MASCCASSGRNEPLIHWWSSANTPSSVIRQLSRHRTSDISTPLCRRGARPLATLAVKTSHLTTPLTQSRRGRGGLGSGVGALCPIHLTQRPRWHNHVGVGGAWEAGWGPCADPVPACGERLPSGRQADGRCLMATTFPSMFLPIILTPASHDDRSATGHLFQFFGVPSPLHRDL
jgi:hypothetical protein